MFRGLLSSRLIQVGLVFFVLVVGGSLLYSWQTDRTTEAGFARTDVVPHETRSEQDTVDTSTVDFEQAETPLAADGSQKSDDTDVAPIDETSEMLDMADAFLPDDFVSEEEAPVEEVPVSPYGFGPYPEVPEDFIQKVGAPPWLREKPSVLPEDTKKGIEILSRVLIKLWKQGDESINGGIRDDTTGLVYPYYDNTIYIRQIVQRNSNDRMAMAIINQVVAPPSLIISVEDMQKLQAGGEAPSGIRVLDFNTAGIDPYQFLNIK